MASPLGHSLASLLVRSRSEPKGWLWTKSSQEWWRTPLAAVVFGSLPDLDLLGSWLVSGNPVTYHQHFTHNVWLALVVGLSVALVARKDCWRAGLWAFSLVALHVVIDAGVGPVLGGPETLGVRAFWPLSEARIGFPVAFVSELHFGKADQIVSWQNVWCVFHETVSFGIPLFLVTWFRK